MQKIRLASITGENGPESHLVLEESEQGSRKILNAYGSLQEARIFGEAFPPKGVKEKAAAA